MTWPPSSHVLWTVGVKHRGYHMSQSRQVPWDEGTIVLSHMYPVSFFFVIVDGKKKSQWNRAGFVMPLYSSSFSKLCIPFSNVNFLSGEQDTIWKYFWIRGKLISLPSVWAGHPSPLAAFHFHNSASTSDDFLSHLSTKEFPRPCGPSLGDWPWLWSIALAYPITCPGSMLTCLLGNS